MTTPGDSTQTNSNIPQSEVTMTGSEGLWNWLHTMNISLAFTTYQTNRLFLVGCKPEGRLGVNERLFDKPMGLYLRDESFYMACRYQIWQLENRLAHGETYHGCDSLYVPCTAYTTGDLNVHDVVMTAAQKLLFINTDFSCLSALRPGYSFEPLWQPPFITKLVAEDRCHLNGLAIQNGEPAYVTACSSTDSAAGWREHRVEGGIAIHIASNEIVATGLSMPHSPRWYQDKLWLLESGTGHFGWIDLTSGQFKPLVFCPGYLRGLAFYGDYAFIGSSLPRENSGFHGLQLDKTLAGLGLSPMCGIFIIDLRRGEIVHDIAVTGGIQELYDVAVLPNVHRPRAIDFTRFAFAFTLTVL